MGSNQSLSVAVLVANYVRFYLATVSIAGNSETLLSPFPRNRKRSSNSHIRRACALALRRFYERNALRYLQSNCCQYPFLSASSPVHHCCVRKLNFDPKHCRPLLLYLTAHLGLPDHHHQQESDGPLQWPQLPAHGILPTHPTPHRLEVTLYMRPLPRGQDIQAVHSTTLAPNMFRHHMGFVVDGLSE